MYRTRWTGKTLGNTAAARTKYGGLATGGSKSTGPAISRPQAASLPYMFTEESTVMGYYFFLIAVWIFADRDFVSLDSGTPFKTSCERSQRMRSFSGSSSFLGA